MALPFPVKCFIVEASDQAKPSAPRNRDDTLPLTITPEDFRWESLKLPPNTPVLKDVPHTENSIYTEVGMSINLSLSWERMLPIVSAGQISANGFSSMAESGSSSASSVRASQAV